MGHYVSGQGRERMVSQIPNWPERQQLVVTGERTQFQ